MAQTRTHRQGVLLRWQSMRRLTQTCRGYLQQKIKKDSLFSSSAIAYRLANNPKELFTPKASTHFCSRLNQTRPNFAKSIPRFDQLTFRFLCNKKIVSTNFLFLV